MKFLCFFFSFSFVYKFCGLSLMFSGRCQVNLFFQNTTIGLFIVTHVLSVFRLKGLSEEEVRAAAACAGEEVMIRNRFMEMNAPKDCSSVSK